MILSQFIDELNYFPQDSEIYISNTEGELKSPIFKLMHFKKYNATGISTTPKTLTQHQMTKNNGDKIWINPYDNFYLWNDTMDVMKFNKTRYNKARLEIAYKNNHKQFDEWYNEYVEFENTLKNDFYTVGGLIKALRNFDKSNIINIQTPNDLLNIYAVRQETREYIGGHPDDLSYDLVNEIDLVCGYNTDYGLINAEKSQLDWHELNHLITDYLYDVRNNIPNMSIKEISDNLSRKIYEYFKLNRKINGSIDCNGYIHLYDKDKPFKQYKREK